jgi:hypothetical protein
MSGRNAAFRVQPHLAHERLHQPVDLENMVHQPVIQEIAEADGNAPIWRKIPDLPAFAPLAPLA